MNHTRCVPRVAALAGLAVALLAFAAAAPAALARPAPPLPLGHVVGPVYKLPARAPVHAVLIGGMADWQITLIAAGTALAAATVAVLLDHARMARKAHATTA